MMRGLAWLLAASGVFGLVARLGFGARPSVLDARVPAIFAGYFRALRGERLGTCAAPSVLDRLERTGVDAGTRVAHPR